jgi:hypothetical protein
MIKETGAKTNPVKIRIASIPHKLSARDFKPGGHISTGKTLAHFSSVFT